MTASIVRFPIDRARTPAVAALERRAVTGLIDLVLETMPREARERFVCDLVLWITERSEW